MAPGIGSLPAAGPATVAALDRYLAAVPPRIVRWLRLALWALELMPFPWRFSRADPGARAAFLRDLDRSGSRLAQDLLLALRVVVGVAYGADPQVERRVAAPGRCAVLDEPPPAPAAPGDGERAGDAADAAAGAPTAGGGLGSLEPAGPEEECDVAIVGSGAGGAAAAKALAEAGLEVIVLEAGPHLDRETYPRDPLAALTALYRDGGLTIATGRPAIPTPVGRAVGGTTVINSGTCFRAPEPLLARWAADHGVEWASELGPEYEAAERLLAVREVDPQRMGRNGQLLRAGAEALGVSHHPLRRNAGRCVQCSSCPTGCRLDAKRAMHVSYLPRAVAAGARVRAGVEVRRIEFAGRAASGLECVAGVADRAAGRPRPYRVRPRRAIVLAAGAFGTPELLIRSGFRSQSGALGRNLRIHPACWVGARFDEPVRGWEGVMQSYAVDEWIDRGLLLEATFTPLAFGGQWLPGTGAEHQRRLLEFDRLAATGVHLSDRSAGRVGVAGDGSLRISYRLTRADAERLTFGIARAAELFYAAGAREVYPQIAGLPILARGAIGALEASPPPRSALRLEAFHPLGTARIDADPRRGVVGADGAVHGAERLYVADASLLPGSLGVNPMLTIIAFAARIASGLAARLA